MSSKYDLLRRENERLREQLRDLDPGCPECGEKTAAFKAVPEGWHMFAPEIFATLRERGIDPTSGHKRTCKSKHG